MHLDRSRIIVPCRNIYVRWGYTRRRHPVYSIHAVRWVNGAPKRLSNGLLRYLSLYFYFTQTAQVSRILPAPPRRLVVGFFRFIDTTRPAFHAAFPTESRTEAFFFSSFFFFLPLLSRFSHPLSVDRKAKSVEEIKTRIRNWIFLFFVSRTGENFPFLLTRAFCRTSVVAQVRLEPSEISARARKTVVQGWYSDWRQSKQVNGVARREMLINFSETRLRQSGGGSYSKTEYRL